MALNTRELFVKLSLLVGLFFLVGYLSFRALFINYTPSLILFSFALLLAELHNLTQLFVMIYSLWPRKYQVFGKLLKNKQAQINIFICVCGEPLDIVRNTAIAAKEAASKYSRILHPNLKPRIVILDDGKAAGRDNWIEIKGLAEELRIDYVSREVNTGFKAGNLNNGMKSYPAENPENTIDIVLDADFAVVPEFLLEITKPFNDKSVDFVQTPQRYSNEHNWIAQASAAHQKHFFNHVVPAKAYDNALFLCGTNFAIKRSALNDVGGVDERFITEDYATSLNLHLNGKKGVFIQKPLAYGVAPSTFKAYFSQQRRWSKGTFDTSLVYWRKILFGNLTIRQKFQYSISSIYYLSGIRNLIFILGPLPYLVFGKSLMQSSSFNFVALIYMPLFLYNLIVYFLLFDYPLKSWVLDTIVFPVYISSFLSSVLKKKLDFIVTIKKFEKENILKAYSAQLLIIFILITALLFGLEQHRAANSIGEYMNYFWAVFSTIVLGMGFYLYIRDNYVLDTEDNKVVRRSKRYLIVVLEKAVLPPLFIILLLGVAYQNSNLKSSAGLVKTQVFANVNGTVHQTLDVPDKGIYYGYYLPSYNRHPEKIMLSPVNGEKPSLMMYYQDWAGDKPFDTQFMNTVSDRNMIPVITWEPWNAEKANKGDLTQPNFSPKLITEGKYDNYIRSWAKQSATYNKPYFLRFAHEMNGDWYSWGNVDGNTPEDYIAMWRHVHNIFQEEGSTNAIWVWAPNNQNSKGNLDDVMDFYPGDNYVDWVGYSGFNWGDTDTYNWSSFKELSGQIYSILTETKKPIMVAETSSVGSASQKSLWIKQLADSLIEMPGIKAVVLYDAPFKKVDFSLEAKKTVDSLTENMKLNSYFIKYPVLQYSKMPGKLSLISLRLK